MRFRRHFILRRRNIGVVVASFVAASASPSPSSFSSLFSPSPSSSFGTARDFPSYASLLSASAVSTFSGGKPGDGLSQMTAEATARLDFRNPNGKLSYYYGDADVAVSVGDGDFETSLGSTKVKGFVEKPGNRTVIIVPFKVNKQQVADPTVKRLQTEMKSKRLVVKVTAKTKVGLAVGKRRIVTVGVTLRCGGVRLQTLDSQMAKCSIKMLKWIRLHS